MLKNSRVCVVRGAAVALLVIVAGLGTTACSSGSDDGASDTQGAAGSSGAGAAGIGGSGGGSAGSAGAGGAAGDKVPFVDVPASKEVDCGDAGEGPVAPVEAFRITKTPTTVAQYRACVNDGACTPPAATTGECTKPDPFNGGLTGPTYGVVGADDVPVSCATFSQAATYCKWLSGGSLPTPEQFLLAARGPKFFLTPWHTNVISCDHHPRANPSVPHQVPCCTNSCEPSAMRVGIRPMNASPYGMTDAIMGNRELLAGGPGVTNPACKEGVFCFVQAGVLDAGSLAKVLVDKVDGAQPFRCVSAPK